MSGNRQLFGPYPYGHSVTDMFTDSQQTLINFEYFRPYFDQVSLSMDLAKRCLGDHYSKYGDGAKQAGFVKFVPFSVLRTRERFPVYDEVVERLIDHSQIPGFTLAGPLSVWGGEDIFSKTPCVFLSHRWLSPEHPDPDGAHLQTVIERVGRVVNAAPDGAAGEVYLWIDYCCLPQKRGERLLTDKDQERLQAGLLFLPEIVKSCDLMILESPDYIERVWCYTELFVWLCKIAEVGPFRNLRGSPLFDSVLARNADQTPFQRENGLSPREFITDNLVFRGYGGSAGDLLDIYEPIDEYCSNTIDSAGYTMGAYEGEYLPNLIRFMCTSWHALQEKGCAIREDAEVCLHVIVKALTFISRFA